MSRRTRQRLSLAALSLLTATPPLLAYNAPYYFVGPDNALFSDPANWSPSPTGPGGTPPADGDVTYVSPPTTPFTLFLDGSPIIGAPANSSLRAAFFNGPAAGDPLVVNVTAPSLDLDNLLIGPNVTFNQPAGQIRATLDIASFSGPNTTYSLSGTALLFGQHVAFDNGVTVLQSGGSVSSNNDVSIGKTGPVAYSLSAGSLHGDDLLLDGPGPISFAQTGGSVGGNWVTAIGRNTTYSLAAGTLSASHALTVGGNPYSTSSFPNAGSTLTQTGGAVVLGESSLSVNSTPGSTALYSLSAGTLSSPHNTPIAIGSSGNGTLLQSGGAIGGGPNSPSAVYLGQLPGSTGTYSLSATGQLNATTLHVGYSGSGSVTQSGGTISLSSTLSLATNSGSSASYSLTGGSLSATSLYVGPGGSATLAQTGGTASVSSLHIGGGSATARYALGPTGPNSPPGSNPYLSAGSIALDGPAPSYFVQNDGSSSVGSVLVGRNASFSFGAYAQTLSVYGSILVGGVPSGAPASYPADAGATFTQYGGYGLWAGASSLPSGADAVTVNANPGSSARFNLSGGNLYFPNHANLTVGSTTTGTFVQTGGELGPYWFIDRHSIPNYPTTVTLGKSAGSSGTYSLSGTGSLLTQALVIGDAGAGAFVQSDGSASAAYLTLAAQPGSSASYTLSGGSLLIAPFTYGAPYSLIVADQGTATFTQTGGSLSTGRFYLAKSAGSSATYNLSGGTLDASPVIGDAGNAYLRQTGGTLTATDLTIADQPSSNSTYDLLGGSLTATTVTNNGTFYMQSPASFAGHTFTNHRSATLDGTQSWPAGSTFTNTLVAYVHSDPAGPSGTPDSATLHFTSASPDWAPVVFDAPATHLASLTLSSTTHASLPAHPAGAAPRLLSTRALSITDTAQLDLADNTLLLTYDTTSPLDTIRHYLHDAHLTSSLSDSTHRLAYAETLSGEPTAPSSLTVSLALTGDANLDGSLTPDDYALLDRAFARSLSNAHWTDGDFNYDGTIDQQDYLLIDSTLGQAQGFSPGFLSTRESQFGASYVSTLLAAVPEPSLACLLAGFLLLPRGRRRQNNRPNQPQILTI